MVEGSAELYCPNCERTFPDGDVCPRDGARLVRIAVPIDPLIGREIDGKYGIVEKIGRGGMGAVYRAHEHDLGREVAIKVLRADLVSDTDSIKRFMREAKLASRLVHPNAVAVLAFGQSSDGLFYLVMELVDGRTLDQVLKNDGVLSAERLVRIGVQVCEALAGAHALQIVHRDLKPANIMLLGRDLVKVLDFGLAKSMIATDQSATTMTNGGALLGTPAFIPPELALGKDCDGRADLYSLGVVLYLLGSGRLPFVSESPHELIAMHGTEQAPPMTGVPPALARVIDRMLRKTPDERYPSAIATRDALEAALDNRYLTPLPFAAQPAPALDSLDAPEIHDTRPSLANIMETMVVRPPKRRWGIVLGAALGVVAIAGGAVIATSSRKEAGNEVVAPVAVPPVAAPANPTPVVVPPTEPPAPSEPPAASEPSPAAEAVATPPPPDPKPKPSVHNPASKRPTHATAKSPAKAVTVKPPAKAEPKAAGSAAPKGTLPF